MYEVIDYRGRVIGSYYTAGWALLVADNNPNVAYVRYTIC
jgi:hypothetical protein